MAIWWFSSIVRCDQGFCNQHPCRELPTPVNGCCRATSGVKVGLFLFLFFMSVLEPGFSYPEREFSLGLGPLTESGVYCRSVWGQKGPQWRVWLRSGCLLCGAPWQGPGPSEVPPGSARSGQASGVGPLSLVYRTEGVTRVASTCGLGEIPRVHTLSTAPAWWPTLRRWRLLLPDRSVSTGNCIRRTELSQMPPLTLQAVPAPYRTFWILTAQQ